MGTVSTNAKETAENLATQLKSMVDAGQEKIEVVKGRLLDGKDRAAERARSMFYATEDAIKAHPLKSIAIAFGVGFLAMRLIRR